MQLPVTSALVVFCYIDTVVWIAVSVLNYPPETVSYEQNTYIQKVIASVFEFQLGSFAVPSCLGCCTWLNVSKVHMHYSHTCNAVYWGQVICVNPTLTASINMIWLTRKSLFVYSGQNGSFCRYWNNSLDLCVGYCTHICQWVVTSGKTWAFADIFHSSFPLCSLAWI